MPRKRPPAVLVLAIFHFIFAAICGVCDVFQLAGGAAAFNKMAAASDPKGAKVQEDIQQAVEKSFPGQRTYQVADALVGVVLALLLLVAGIGLLNMQPWGRLLSLAWAVLE